MANVSQQLRWSGVLLMLGYGSAIAPAQGATDPIYDCARVTDAGARLSCFDRAAQQHQPVAATHEKHADDTVGLDGKQLIIARKKEGIQPQAVPNIIAAIARFRRRPDHSYDFELDNGQVWESTDTQPDLFLGPHETVTIRAGVLGAFFMKTAAGNSVRVHRLR